VPLLSILCSRKCNVVTSDESVVGAAGVEVNLLVFTDSDVERLRMLTAAGKFE
jgi:hypothetical protein